MVVSVSKFMLHLWHPFLFNVLHSSGRNITTGNMPVIALWDKILFSFVSFSLFFSLCSTTFGFLSFLLYCYWLFMRAFILLGVSYILVNMVHSVKSHYSL